MASHTPPRPARHDPVPRPGLAAPGVTGPLSVTGYDGRNLSTTALTAVDPDGTVLWRRAFDGHPEVPRVSVGGTVWIAHADAGGHTSSEVDAAGTVLRSITPEHAPDEHLGAFVLLPDGICVAWLPAAPRRVVPPGRSPRVARYGGAATRSRTDEPRPCSGLAATARPCGTEAAGRVVALLFDPCT